MINIYKASAGAGKTHKLTGEYIKLLFTGRDAYRHILAVTFTNKATDEMKQRILQELYILKENGNSDYLNELVESTGMSAESVREEAGNILVAILHDYTSFRVSTIDRFFQLVLRSFARELGRMATYNVELDRNMVLERAIDRMFLELDEPQNRKLLDWLIEYSLDAVDNGDSWNIRGEILKLGGQLFSEDFKLAMESSEVEGGVAGTDEIAVFKRELKKNVHDFESAAAAMAREALEHISGYALDLSDFKGGSRTPLNYFNVLANWNGKGTVPPPGATFSAMYNCMEKWYAGKKCPAQIEQAYPQLNDIVGEILMHFSKGFTEYSTSVAVLANINVMGIINDIYRRVIEYCREKNIILLQESTGLLGKIIDGSDTPFVYEKIGVRLSNFMLDEFQDTSELQWRNFYPLLQNSLAQGYSNLIVGDVKQSIYRWRGSNWKILGENIYGQFRNDQIRDWQLDCNYRSGANIVEFNNRFFDYCAKAAQQLYDASDHTIEKIYEGFAQTVSSGGEKERGSVEIEFLSNEDGAFMENALELLPQKIDMLLRQGYRMGDIAILVRRASEGNAVAQKLLECGYDIISSDSLYISSSFAVQKVVNILKGTDDPNSGSLKIMKKFCAVPVVERIERYSLYQLCETIIREALTSEEQMDVAPLQGFLDLVLEFTRQHGTNIAQFVKWWDESGVNCTISAPEDMDAIRIMTIHKSKGLGFEVVIVPFLKENLDHIPSMAPNMWCTYKGRAVPVKYGKMLADTCFAEEYSNERLCAFVDALNAVYVAFTRPKRELLVFAPQPKKTKNGYASPMCVSDILFAYYLKYRDEMGWNDKIVMGAPAKGAYGSNKVPVKLIPENLFSSPVNANRTRTVASGGTIGEGESIREHGIAMHHVFSLINHKDDIERAVSEACAGGFASCGYSSLLAMIKEKIAAVDGYGWFNGSYTVVNECSILTPDGRERRPDRVLIKGNEAVVVDYKFGVHSNSYIKQVSGYMDLLTCMGYENVKGYIWYIPSGEIISV